MTETRVTVIVVFIIVIVLSTIGIAIYMRMEKFKILPREFVYSYNAKKDASNRELIERVKNEKTLNLVKFIGNGSYKDLVIGKDALLCCVDDNKERCVKMPDFIKRGESFIIG